MKQSQRIRFSDLMTQVRINKANFLSKIDEIIDWRRVSNIINKHYQKGISADGRPAYPGLMLFKMSLLQTWFGLSDYEAEEQVNDRISFSRFIGLSMEKTSPDHSVLSRFRTELTQKGVYEKRFKEFNKQLEKRNVIVKNVVLVDASIIETPLKPKGKPTYRIPEDRDAQESSFEEDQTENQPVKLLKEIPPGADTEASWVKKGGKLQYGYKKHVLSDPEGMVLTVVTTKASVHEISNLEEVLDTVELPKGVPLFADKGYASEKNRTMLRERGLKDGIMKRAVRGKALSEKEKEFNRCVSKIRYRIDRVFGSIKRWFRSGYARYRGIGKMHTQNLMEAIAHNLYRTPGIFASLR